MFEYNLVLKVGYTADPKSIYCTFIYWNLVIEGRGSTIVQLCDKICII